MGSRLLRTCQLSAALAVAACLAADAAPTRAEDEAAIRALFEKHIAAFTAGDSTAASAFYADNAVMMPPDRAAMTGKEAIRWGLRVAFGLVGMKFTGGSIQVETAGDWAFARRTSAMLLTAKTGGEQLEVMADWLEVLKRQPDGSWKVQFEMVNSDRPLPALNQ